MLHALRIPVEKLKAKEIDSVKDRVTCLRWELGASAIARRDPPIGSSRRASSSMPGHSPGAGGADRPKNNCGSYEKLPPAPGHGVPWMDRPGPAPLPEARGRPVRLQGSEAGHDPLHPGGQSCLRTGSRTFTSPAIFSRFPAPLCISWKPNCGDRRWTGSTCIRSFADTLTGVSWPFRA